MVSKSNSPHTARIVALLCAYALIAFTGCASHDVSKTATAAGPVSAPSHTPMDNYVRGVPNFGFVTDQVWRGGMPTDEGFKTLAAMGVRTVIDLQEDDRSADIPPGVRYVPCRVSGWLADRVDTEAVLRAIEQCPKPVFIHCRLGRDRTGLAVAAYRLSQGMTATGAIDEARRFRMQVWWRSSIARQIRRLEAANAAAPASRPSESPAAPSMATVK
jgi:protein tyrosine phosphatase (PTP) superfamily phosphohydrolase (DUF442 family)